MKRIAALILLAFALVACGEPAPKEGYVRDKEYDDADEWEEWIPGHTIYGSQSCTGGYGNQPRVCTRTPDIHIPGRFQHRYDPEHWRLKIESKPNDEGKTKTGWRNVDETTWHRCQINEWCDTRE